MCLLRNDFFAEVKIPNGSSPCLSSQLAICKMTHYQLEADFWSRLDWSALLWYVSFLQACVTRSRQADLMFIDMCALLLLYFTITGSITGCCLTRLVMTLNWAEIIPSKNQSVTKTIFKTAQTILTSQFLTYIIFSSRLCCVVEKKDSSRDWRDTLSSPALWKAGPSPCHPDCNLLFTVDTWSLRNSTA